MKKQINPTIKAHLIRGAFYVLLLLAVCLIRFALAERNSGSGQVHRLPPDLAGMMEPASQKQHLRALPSISQNRAANQTTSPATLCSKVAFSSDRDGNDEIYVTNPDGTNPTRLTNNTAIDDFPDISPDGSKITFESNRSGNFEIYVMNADGSGQTRLTFSGSNTNPAFSPDGTKIVFISTRSVAPGRGVWVINSDGTSETQLAPFTTSVGGRPHFSPDGSKIVFDWGVVGPSGLRGQIFIMNSNGSNVTNITNNSSIDDYDPAYSPDGTTIVFSSDGPGGISPFNLWTMSPDGTGRVNLTNDSDVGHYRDYPYYSPDGSQIAFLASFAEYQNGIYQIHVMNADGTGETNISNNASDDMDPSWGACPNTTCVGPYEISQLGGSIVPGTTDIGNHCDDCSTTVALPFSYTLYDQTYTSIDVSSNGTASFTASDFAPYTNLCLPDTINFTGGYTIYPYWDDLKTDFGSGCDVYPGGTCGIYTSVSGTAPNRIFNIEWRAEYVSGFRSANFELRLYEGQTRFDVIYGQLDNGNTSATAGVQKGVSNFTEYFCEGSGGAATGGQSYVLGPCPSPTPTPTATPTATFTPTPTATATFTPTPTATFTPTATATATFTPTATATSTFTPTATATFTPTATATFTPLPTATFTPLPTATFTPLPTATFTPTATATFTPTATATFTPLPTATFTPLPTATFTPLPTATFTPTATATFTPTATATFTPLPTATFTPLPTATFTPLPTATFTPTATATFTPTPTATATFTPTATATFTPTATATATQPPPTPTATATFTPTPTATATFTPTATATFTPTPTATFTPTPTPTAPSPTPTATFTPTPTPTATYTPTPTATATATATATFTPTSTPTATATATFTPTATATFTPTPTPTAPSPTPTATFTPTPTPTATATATLTPTATATFTPTATATFTPTATATFTPTPTATFTPTATATATQPPPTPTATATATPGPITLTANGYKVNGVNTVDLFWTGATSANVDIYRDGVLIATVPNTGSYTDSTGQNGSGTFTYKVCDAGTPNCSNLVTVRFGGPAPTPTATPTPTPGGISLTANAYKVKGVDTVDLFWNDAISTNVDIYRNDVLIATVPNTGNYTDNTGQKGSATFTYKVCEASTQTCSIQVIVIFGGG